ncbi:hypothetical protein JOC95_000584 [Bacillus tianshenii]|uniref:Endospore appendages core domain-containing protein n=1 Tax=Sutcliffiella tianshenii TaxID=1463404 RepID=A0ABS2NVV5_9BACI|nr:S-Ena type endospore appendage [Bacillus tianshenii]MBM7618742.1 hypothetical protein [Bacillus tianshenii]
MCSTNGSANNCCCCPSPTVIQEKICGNLNGPLLNYTAWEGPEVNDYIQGTFEIFNAGPEDITAQILDSLGATVGTIDVPPGNSVAVSVNNPNTFNVQVPEGTRGKFCITLYKRLFA